MLRELAHEAEERRRIWQLLSESLYGVDHPLAFPILGTGESLAAIGIDDLDQVRDSLVRRPTPRSPSSGPSTRRASWRRPRRSCSRARGTSRTKRDPKPEPAGRRHEERRSGLLHIACGWRFGGVDDDNLARAAASPRSCWRTSLGIAPVRPAAHTAASCSPTGLSTVLIPYRDSGFLAAVTACDPHHAAQAEAALVGEVERLASRGPTFSELEAARRQLHGSLARAYEVSRRLAGLSATQLLFDRLEPVDDLFARIAACEPADVAGAAAALVGPGQTHAIASLGRRPR